MPKRCETGSRARCRHCSEIKHGDLKAVARSGFVDRPVNLGALLTLTAPGADVLGWDTDACGHAEDGSECSGEAGCRVDPMAAAAWHRSLARRWSWFITYLRRALGVDVQFMKAYEWQKRGALHVHAMVRINGVVSQRRVRAAVRWASRKWEFGRQFDVSFFDADDDRAVARSAGYCAKYIAKGYDQLGSVSMLDVTTGELCSRRLRPWSASRSWGLTMCAMRARRAAWWADPGQGAAAPAGAAGLDLKWNLSTPDLSGVTPIPSHPAFGAV